MYQEFIENNFELDTAVVLTTKKLNPPVNFNPQFQLRKITSEHDWLEVLKLQTLCADPKHLNANYAAFKRRQMAEYRKMAEAGLGCWFGAFTDGQLIADLGIFFEGQFGRYRNVGTHPDHRRKGYCGSLVYLAGLIAFKEFGVSDLIMEADTEYHAAKIYESVGFERREENFALSWWRGKNP